MLTGLRVDKLPDGCVAVASLSSKDKEISAVGDKPCKTQLRHFSREEPAGKQRFMRKLHTWRAIPCGEAEESKAAPASQSRARLDGMQLRGSIYLFRELTPRRACPRGWRRRIALDVNRTLLDVKRKGRLVARCSPCSVSLTALPSKVVCSQGSSTTAPVCQAAKRPRSLMPEEAIISRGTA